MRDRNNDWLVWIVEWNMFIGKKKSLIVTIFIDGVACVTLDSY
jgi:hypothetical protein